MNVDQDRPRDLNLLTSRKEMARFLGVSEKTVSRLIKKNKMPEPLHISEGTKKKNSRSGFKRYVFSHGQLESLKTVLQARKKHYNR